MISKNELAAFYTDQKKLDSDLKFFEASSPEDKKVFEWLSEDREVWPALCEVFEGKLSTRIGFSKWIKQTEGGKNVLSAKVRRVGAYFVLLELREFAGHSLWNLLGKTPHYEDIVKNVHERVSKQFGETPKKRMSVSDRELSLSAIILKDSLEQLSSDKVLELLKDSDLGPTRDLDFQRMKKSVLGKIGTVGSAKTLSQILSRIFPVAAKRAGLWVGVGFLAKDMYDLGGEATRVTNPAVVLISLYRSFSAR